MKIRSSAAFAAALALAGGLLALGTSPASAKAAPTGDFAVTVNGTTYNPSAGKDVKLTDVRPAGTIRVRGVNVGFDLDPVTLGVSDYRLGSTVLFASKVPTLTAAQRANVTLKQLEVRDDSLVAILQTAAGKLKIQAKDAPTGGIFQMEPEFGSATEITHVLGPDLFYFVNPFTGKINFGDGAALIGKDSPQVATKTFQDGTTTRWLVASGGRMGGVIGEDAVELSQGATNCTSQCQAQNRIRGSLPVPPLPTDPTPIG